GSKRARPLLPEAVDVIIAANFNRLLVLSVCAKVQSETNLWSLVHVLGTMLGFIEYSSQGRIVDE
ncbi:hypothetical protein, partial [Halopseudomonas sp.]|uniref:hypothetical protein n=1 Tax=Halopseudomonas sp. TaxID=2901191 RepID=UPI0030030C35